MTVGSESTAHAGRGGTRFVKAWDVWFAALLGLTCVVGAWRYPPLPASEVDDPLLVELVGREALGSAEFKIAWPGDLAGRPLLPPVVATVERDGHRTERTLAVDKTGAVELSLSDDAFGRAWSVTFSIPEYRYKSERIDIPPIAEPPVPEIASPVIELRRRELGSAQFTVQWPDVSMTEAPSREMTWEARAVASGTVKTGRVPITKWPPTGKQILNVDLADETPGQRWELTARLAGHTARAQIAAIVHEDPRVEVTVEPMTEMEVFAWVDQAAGLEGGGP